jgi:hypothetical protein
MRLAGRWSCPVGRHPDGRAAPDEDVYRSAKFGFDAEVYAATAGKTTSEPSLLRAISIATSLV